MIKVQLKDGEIKEFEAGISAFDAARELGLAKTACAAEAEVEFGDLGATISSHALYAVANLERQNYADMKGGK